MYFSLLICLNSRKVRYPAGFSLLEVTVAVAIFMLVLGAMAQALIYAYGALVLQRQQTSALSSCTAIVATLRQLSRTLPESELCAADLPLFPCVLVEWADQFPASRDEAQSSVALMDQFGGFYSLPDQTFEIAYADAQGNDIVVSPQLHLNTNPVFVRVTTSWLGLRGRTYNMTMNSVITNE